MAVVRLPYLLIIVTVLLVSCMPDGEPTVDRGYQAYEQGNYARALREWRPLAEAGHALAQTHLGFMHDQGHGVDQDYAEAMRWYRLAAEQGNARAQFNLGDMHEAGDGVPQDHAEAMRWYRLAAVQGHAEAQNRLGTLYQTGLGGLQDYGEAIRWYRLAAEQGNVSAMMQLGRFFDGKDIDGRSAFGLITPEHRELRDRKLAHKWYNLAAARGEADAVRQRNNLTSRMTPAEVAEAQTLAREWLAERDADSELREEG